MKCSDRLGGVNFSDFFEHMYYTDQNNANNEAKIASCTKFSIYFLGYFRNVFEANNKICIEKFISCIHISFFKQFNTFTGDDSNSCLNRENLLLLLKMHLFTKDFLSFLIVFWVSTLNFEHFPKKKKLYSLSIFWIYWL